MVSDRGEHEGKYVWGENITSSVTGSDLWVVFSVVCRGRTRSERGSEEVDFTITLSGNCSFLEPCGGCSVGHCIPSIHRRLWRRCMIPICIDGQWPKP